MNFHKLKVVALNKTFYLLNYFVSFLIPYMSFLIPQTPFVLHIRITNKCNLSCPFCYLKEGLNRKEESPLSLDEWRRIFEKLPSRTIVDITGAEPFMACNFNEFLMLIKEFKFKCSITTNGTVYNDKTIETIFDNNIDYLLISLDGLEETHNNLRGNTNAFGRTIEFINKIQAYTSSQKRPIINIKTMLLDENHGDILPLIEFCESQIRPDAITINLPFQNSARGGLPVESSYNHDKFHGGNTHIYKNPKEIDTTFSLILRKKNRSRIPIIFKPMLSVKDIRRYIETPQSVPPRKCPLYKNNLTIYHDGTVAPCDISLNIGNMRELNFNIKKIYHLNEFKQFKKRKAQSNKVCEGCVFS